MLVLVEFMLFLLAVAFVATQLFWPILMDRPPFPIFKYRRQKQRLHNVQDDIERVKLEQDIARAKQVKTKLRQEISKNESN